MSKLSSLILSCLVVFGGAQIADASIDTAVRSSIDASVVAELKGHGLMTETDENLDVLLTRADVLKMSMMAAGTPLDVFEGDRFSDIDPSAWWAPYIWKAAHEGWVRGYADGTFRAESSVTMAEAFKIVSTVLGVQIDGGAATDWRLPYMHYFAHENLGLFDRSLSPELAMTKREWIHVLKRVLGHLKGETYDAEVAMPIVEKEADVESRSCPEPIYQEEICRFDTPVVLERDLNGCPIAIGCEVLHDDTPPVVKVDSPSSSIVRESPFDIRLSANEPIACEFYRSCVRDLRSGQESCFGPIEGVTDDDFMNMPFSEFADSHVFTSDLDNHSRYDVTFSCTDKGGNFVDKRVVFDTDLPESAASENGDTASGDDPDFPEATGILKVKLASDPSYGEKGSPRDDMKVFGFEVVSRSGNAHVRMESVELTVSGGVNASGFKLFDASNRLVDSSSVVHAPGSTTKVAFSFSGAPATSNLISGGGSQRYYVKADLSASVSDQAFHVQIADLGNGFSDASNPGDLIFSIEHPTKRGTFSRIYWVDQSPNQVSPMPMTFSSF